MPRPRTVFIALSVAVGARPLAAQNLPGDLVAYASLNHTPLGLLVPVAPRVQIDGIDRGVSLAARFASLAKGPLNNKTRAYAGTAFLPAGQHAVVSLTAGTYRETCPDPECKNILMLGAGGQLDLAPNLFNSAIGEPRVALGLTGDAGWSARQFQTTHLDATVGVPITVVVDGRRPGLRLAPWITPGVGFARVSLSGTHPGDDVQTGTRPMVSGGLALYNPSSRLSLQLGATHVVESQSRTALGLNLVLGW